MDPQLIQSGMNLLFSIAQVSTNITVYQYLLGLVVALFTFIGVLIKWFVLDIIKRVTRIEHVLEINGRDIVQIKTHLGIGGM